MRICFAAFLLLCCAIPVLAQVDTGTISGVVADQTGAVVPDARVVIVQLDTNTHVQLLTNSSGLYTSPPLRPGRYEITVMKDGFQTQKSQPLDLRVQDRA